MEIPGNKSDGAPLRAKVDATFIGYQNGKEPAKEAKALSPDLSRVVEVREGDTLPPMCHKAHGSGCWYLDVAGIDGLSDFRNLAPGTTILFPPLGSGQ